MACSPRPGKRPGPAHRRGAGEDLHHHQGQGLGREGDRVAATNEELEELGLFTKARNAARGRRTGKELEEL